MNFHDTKMGHSFFERQLPQLIRSIDALAAALGKPVQPVVLPVEADPEFLSKLYLGEYESAPFQQTPEGAELTRAVNKAHEELEALLPESCHEKLMQYQDALTMREGVDLQRAYESGYRTAVQMIVAGLSRPVSRQTRAEEAGVCPICGGELDYEDDIHTDDGGFYPWKCINCKATGKEGYDKVFDQHYDVEDKDGTPFHAPAE